MLDLYYFISFQYLTIQDSIYLIIVYIIAFHCSFQIRDFLNRKIGSCIKFDRLLVMAR